MNNLKRGIEMFGEALRAYKGFPTKFEAIKKELEENGDEVFWLEKWMPQDEIAMTNSDGKIRKIIKVVGSWDKCS